ncbi:hypothetical protein J4573_21510 [Actinomadura barringtoniae]|uniref:Uncharacterized protein n=1 Tax=Actinomadura barringtoniae TaxID=1427535 RepID=A0A939T5M2_9ACTN|nr:hypothetical protein [Actinomadura barringtoniae]MBO2449694.1 hypothetical protein [Actinomadura barringtoniae]
MSPRRLAISVAAGVLAGSSMMTGVAQADDASPHGRSGAATEHARSATAAACNAWALADLKDGTTNMYGAGGASCRSKSSFVIAVRLFGGYNVLAKKIVKCKKKVYACTTYTPYVRDRWRGKQMWCTEVGVVVNGRSTYSKKRCVRH